MISSGSSLNVQPLLLNETELSADFTQPEVHILPEIDMRWVVGETLSVDVLAENVSGMRGLYFEICWKGYYDLGLSDWIPVLNTSLPQINVHEDILPEPYKAYNLNVTIAPEKSWLRFLCMLDCATAPQNGSAKIMTINFTALDPWSGGRQPKYTQTTCKWKPENATTQIIVWWGYLVLQYPNLHYAYFGEFYGNTEGKAGYALYGNNSYSFTPVPGDLDGNGKVDTIDMNIISQFYSADVKEYPNGYYDLNRDGEIDVCDMVVVASNFGRTDPFGGSEE
jgi:hypothetical protein